MDADTKNSYPEQAGLPAGGWYKLGRSAAGKEAQNKGRVNK